MGWERAKSAWTQRNIFSWGLSRLLCPPRPRDQQHNSGPSDSSSIQAKLNKRRAPLDSIHHVPIPFPYLHPALLYDQVSLNETVSKSSFLFHTDNIIFIKLIFQEALFYSDFPEPWEIILFPPLGLKENLSITNVCQQHNFFCKKFDIARKRASGWRYRYQAKLSEREIHLLKHHPLCFFLGCVLSECSQEWFQNR